MLAQKKTILALVFGVFTLSSCGLKGPLYQQPEPQKSEKTIPAEQQKASSDQSNQG